MKQTHMNVITTFICHCSNVRLQQTCQLPRIIRESHIFLKSHGRGNSCSHSPRHKHWPAGPAHFSDRRASTFFLSLAHTGHLDIRRATRFKIVLARTMTNHSMYFSRGRPSHISAVFGQSFCYSETPECRESEAGMSIKHTDVSV